MFVIKIEEIVTHNAKQNPATILGLWGFVPFHSHTTAGVQYVLL